VKKFRVDTPGLQRQTFKCLNHPLLQDTKVKTMASSTSDIKIGVLLTIGAVSALIVITSVLGMTALVRYSFKVERDRKAAMAQPSPHLDRSQSLLNIKTGQLSDIGRYRMLDEETGRVAVPIDRAMEMYVQAHQRE